MRDVFGVIDNDELVSEMLEATLTGSNSKEKIYKILSEKKNVSPDAIKKRIQRSVDEMQIKADIHMAKENNKWELTSYEIEQLAQSAEQEYQRIREDIDKVAHKKMAQLSGKNWSSLVSTAFVFNPHNHRVCREMAIVLRQNGHINKALALLSMLYYVSIENEDKEDAAKILNSMAGCEIDLGNFNVAEKMYTKAISMAKDKFNIATYYMNIASMQVKKDCLDSALEFLDKAAESLNDRSVKKKDVKDFWSRYFQSKTFPQLNLRREDKVKEIIKKTMNKGVDKMIRRYFSVICVCLFLFIPNTLDNNKNINELATGVQKNVSLADHTDILRKFMV